MLWFGQSVASAGFQVTAKTNGSRRTAQRQQLVRWANDARRFWAPYLAERHTQAPPGG